MYVQPADHKSLCVAILLRMNTDGTPAQHPLTLHGHHSGPGAHLSPRALTYLDIHVEEDWADVAAFDAGESAVVHHRHKVSMSARPCSCYLWVLTDGSIAHCCVTTTQQEPTHQQEPSVTQPLYCCCLHSSRKMRGNIAALFHVFQRCFGCLQRGAQQDSTTRRALRWPITCPTTTRCRPQQLLPWRQWSWLLR